MAGFTLRRAVLAFAVASVIPAQNGNVKQTANICKQYAVCTSQPQNGDINAHEAIFRQQLCVGPEKPLSTGTPKISTFLPSVGSVANNTLKTSFLDVFVRTYSQHSSLSSRPKRPSIWHPRRATYPILYSNLTSGRPAKDGAASPPLPGPHVARARLRNRRRGPKRLNSR